eukprot:4493820-Prymnesium_polylepis.1
MRAVSADTWTQTDGGWSEYCQGHRCNKGVTSKSGSQSSKGPQGGHSFEGSQGSPPDTPAALGSQRGGSQEGPKGVQGVTTRVTRWFTGAVTGGHRGVQWGHRGSQVTQAWNGSLAVYGVGGGCGGGRSGGGGGRRGGNRGGVATDHGGGGAGEGGLKPEDE